jgi:hypothetical protein
MPMNRIAFAAFALGISLGLTTLHSAAQAQPAAPQAVCDPTLWNHVYAGDPRKFASPRDRLQVIEECVTVTGTIEFARPEKDGDYHIGLRLDPPFSSMVNDRNTAEERGDLVLEPVCENPVTQRDTLEEGACTDFHQDIFTPDMVGQHVAVTGAYVTDMEHGWREIHPVTSITPIP